MNRIFNFQGHSVEAAFVEQITNSIDAMLGIRYNKLIVNNGKIVCSRKQGVLYNLLFIKMGDQ